MWHVASIYPTDAKGRLALSEPELAGTTDPSGNLELAASRRNGSSADGVRIECCRCQVPGVTDRHRW